MAEQQTDRRERKGRKDNRETVVKMIRMKCAKSLSLKSELCTSAETLK